MRVSVFLFIVSVFVFSSIPFAEAKVLVHQSTKYYNVTGKTGQEVYRKMTKRGPRAAGLRHALAATRGKIDVRNIKLGVQGRNCVIQRANVHLSLTYYIPRWSNKHRASAKARKAWERYVLAIVAHEKVHGKYFRETANNYDSALRKLKGRVSTGCRGMVGVAKRAVRSIVLKGDARHARFDRAEMRKSSKIRKLERAFYLSK